MIRYTGVDEETVVASIEGTIRYLSNDSAGTALIIEKPGSKFQVRYYHLSERNVEDGAYVTVDDTIAISGNTGESEGPHLHFQLQFTDNKNYSYNPIEIYHRCDTRST